MSMVWRVDVPMRRVITEFTEAWIGKPPRGLVRAKSKGKAYRSFGKRFGRPGDSEAAA
ncbi:hypothetical protein ACFQFQ_26900 [Sulfitobacter porphyrae]|uniref:Uncharacterized protein n=1 Tax=Sulfitobacter porphyrae TaxID=1246864 RepID=A0ABW2BA07_9RHOB